MTEPQAIVPVFLLSPPRSGSTLVQRVLAAHEGVATASEPWLLLPLLSPLRDRLPQGDTLAADVHAAVTDFTAVLPGGDDDYRGAMRAAALELYRGAAPPGTRLFVDKTPPYSMIVDEIARTFPEAPMVFLWRNPLSVLASVVETFAGGRWRPADYPLSLFWGPAALVEGYRTHRSRAHGVRYEDLLAGDEAAWISLCEYVGVEFDPAALDGFARVRLTGRMGDPTGVHRYESLSTETLQKWRATISSPLRRAWCRRYLRWLGAERLAVMGYDLEHLLCELDRLDPTGGSLATDLLDTASSVARAAVKAQLGRHEGAPAPWRSLLGAR